MVETVRVPVARNADGSPITGPVVVRWSDLTSGTNTLSLRNAGFYSINALGLGAYLPATLDTRDARLETRAAETMTGEPSGVRPIAERGLVVGRLHERAVPGRARLDEDLPEQGADPALLYQLVYTARDPLVLMLGLAAFRDVGSFFRYEARDGAGTAEPDRRHDPHGGRDGAIAVGELAEDVHPLRLQRGRLGHARPHRVGRRRTRTSRRGRTR